MPRLFIALHVPADAGQNLLHQAQHLVRDHGGRPVAASNLHVTLCFLGELESARIPEVVAAAETVRCRATALRLVAIEHWPRPGILCAVAADDADAHAVAALSADIHVAMRAAGFAPDSKPFRPHVTLIRHVRAQPLVPRLELPSPCRIGFPGMTLLRSERGPAGVSYLPEHDWRS